MQVILRYYNLEMQLSVKQFEMQVIEHLLHQNKQRKQFKRSIKYELPEKQCWDCRMHNQRCDFPGQQKELRSQFLHMKNPHDYHFLSCHGHLLSPTWKIHKETDIQENSIPRIDVIARTAKQNLWPCKLLKKTTNKRISQQRLTQNEDENS